MILVSIYLYHKIIKNIVNNFRCLCLHASDTLAITSPFGLLARPVRRVIQQQSLLCEAELVLLFSLRSSHSQEQHHCSHVVPWSEGSSEHEKGKIHRWTARAVEWKARAGWRWGSERTSMGPFYVTQCERRCTPREGGYLCSEDRVGNIWARLHEHLSSAQAELLCNHCVIAPFSTVDTQRLLCKKLRQNEAGHVEEERGW